VYYFYFVFVFLNLFLSLVLITEFVLWYDYFQWRDGSDI